jgi:hypothetical protein
VPMQIYMEITECLVKGRREMHCKFAQFRIVARNHDDEVEPCGGQK